MEYRVLGPVEVVRDGRVSTPRGAKERAVLARLLMEPGRTVAAGALLDAVWPGTDPEAAARSLQVRLANLRSFLEPEREAGAPSSLLVRDGDGYRLAIDPAEVDAVRFERLVRDGGTRPPAEALAVYDEALELWRGAPFADVADDELVRVEIGRLEELRSHAAEARARALVELGRHEDAVPELRRLAADAPLREELARTLALALYRAGRQVEALDVLRALGDALRELGLDRSAETQKLEQAILVHDASLAASAPPPAAAPAAAEPLPPASRLPSSASRFFGRVPHLAHATELVAEHRLVTITGVGGAGKTRLALELAERLASDYPEGAWWCELAPAGTDADVVGLVGAALALESAADDRVVDHLATRAGVLVLDNCEHVLDGAGELAERLMRRCRDLRVLATSRAPLGVEGEQVLRLSGLELPAGRRPDAVASPAVELFLDRAAAAGAAVDPETDFAAIAELCGRLDGLPLAIELAAGRTRSMTPAEIAARLDERFSLLSVSGRRAAARHSTLRAAIDWSYELLGDPQRRVFERLSVFSRGCLLADAEDVCSGDGVDPAQIPALLDELVAHSLVTARVSDGATRYGLLETLRQYGTARLEERGEYEPVRARHAQHYADLSTRMVEEGWLQAKLPFVDEFDDLRSAIRWCLAHDDGPERAFAIVEALWWPAAARHGEEIAALAEEVLAQWPDPHPRLHHVHGSAAMARLVIGDAEGARRRAEAAVAMESPDVIPALLARRTLAQLQFFGDDREAAIEQWRALAELARASGYPHPAYEADGFVVQLLHVSGNVDAAVDLAGEMRAEADRSGSPFLVSWSRYVSGLVLMDRDPGAAREMLEELLTVTQETDHHHMTRFALRALGVAAALRGDHAEAAQRLERALAHDEATSDGASQWTTLMAVAVLLAEASEPEAAAELLAASEGWPAGPYLVALTRRERERVEAELDADALAAAEARGQTRDLGAAKALALERLSALSSP